MVVHQVHKCVCRQLCNEINVLKDDAMKMKVKVEKMAGALEQMLELESENEKINAIIAKQDAEIIEVTAVKANAVRVHRNNYLSFLSGCSLLVIVDVLCTHASFDVAVLANKLNAEEKELTVALVQHTKEKANHVVALAASQEAKKSSEAALVVAEEAKKLTEAALAVAEEEKR